MKKIVALVLSLVMVLGLATTAFAAADTYDYYKVDATKFADGKLIAGVSSTNTTAFEITEHAAVQNSDGSGNLVYYTLNTTNKYFVKTTAPTVADYAVTAHGKTDILFYLSEVKAEDVKYVAEGKAFADFGTKCGQLYNVDTTKTYVEVTKTSAANPVKESVYTVALPTDDSTYSVLVDGKIVKVDTPAVEVVTALAINKILKHNWAVTGVAALANGTTYPTEVKCLNCGAVVTTLYKSYTLVPAGNEYVDVPGYTNSWVFVEPAAAATTTPVVDGEKVESAETFDAGIAMYVGMSVMAAAGSAVVLKKKD